jgi:orotate phosphoribosyltransferase
MSAAAERARLIEIIKHLSVETGRTFKLASGRTSDFYCNLKPTMMDPEGAYLLGRLIAEAIDDIEADLVGGLEIGAVPLATATAAMSFARGRPRRAFFVRKQAKDHGTQNLIDGLRRGETVAAKRVIILEDVTTTGGSSMKAIEAVKAAGASVALVLTVVDRQEGAAETFRAAGVPFRALITASELR